MLIYACVSAHGFGHGSRTASVLCELAQLRPDWRLVLSTALPHSFLELAFGPVPFERRPCRWDVGVIQADALSSDPAATLEALRRLDLELPAQIEREARWLADQNDTVVVLADVPPAATQLAAAIGAPLAWLASFGWDAIYGPMGGELAERGEAMQALYRRGSLLLRCPLAMPMPWGLPEVALGLTSGRPRGDAQQLRRQLALPSQRERCVLVIFGGMGLGFDPRVLDRWPEHVVIGVEPGLASAANGRLLPQGLRPLDVMPLASRLITKPGYSSFCEAFSQGLGVHLVHRGGFAEAPVLERDLRRHGRHRLLSQVQFRRGDWQLGEPLEEPEEGPLAPDGARVAAAALEGLAVAATAL